MVGFFIPSLTTYLSLFLTSEKLRTLNINSSTPSHSQTARDTLEISVAPVIFSHSSAQALCNSARNVPDQLLKLTVRVFPPWDFFSVSSFQAAKKGLVMINFFSYFITCSNVSSITDVIGRPSRILEGALQYLSCSTYQPREGGCGNRLRGYRSQLRRHQCVSNRFTRARLYVSYLLGFPRDWRTCPSMPISSPPSTAPATGLFSTSRNSLASTFSGCGGRWKRQDHSQLYTQYETRSPG